MKKIKNLLGLIIGATVLLSACSDVKSTEESIRLKDAFKDKFLIGTALNENQYTGKDSLAVAIIRKHFNAIVAENCMKSEVLQPEEGIFDFTQADQFVAFGEANRLFMTGHCLIWHSQAPAWFFVDKKGNDVSREVLIERMRTHIFTVMSRYKGIIKGWDVVNEAIEDDGSWRKSKFYTLLGEDFVRLAFQFAHEADPAAELYYNDYSMSNEGRRNEVIRMVKSLQAQNIPIHGIGMQGHCGMNYPSLEAFEKSIIAFSELGVKVMITEFDMGVLPMPNANAGADVSLVFDYQQEMNPYSNRLPEIVENAWTERFNAFFQLFLKHSDKISRVSFWGVTDADSWKNDWPIRGRTDYPLLFDRNYQPKNIVQLICHGALDAPSPENR
ncbi:beta-xylanase [Bacteroidia bacterium]|nr:beta-xylanase [Bacteroidia bacterium]GHU70784.1 beta-xylanase [Bacteroidia bacterium]